MLDGYGKEEQEDLDTAEKKLLRRLAEEFKYHAREAARRWKGSVE